MFFNVKEKELLGAKKEEKFIKRHDRQSSLGM